MSLVRLGLTGLAVAVAAIVLLALAADPVTCLRALRRAPEVAAAGAAETVVLALTGLLAWVTWAWGAVGLLLTAAGALPGLLGELARAASPVLLPERLRAAAALALGMGLAVAGPAAAAPGATSGPPDWPAAVAGSPGPPDWPPDRTAQQPPATPAEVADRHVVVAGDCLWRIAEDHLDRSGAHPDDAQVARSVAAWFSGNAEVIGPDPDLIHPGQVLQAPPADPHSPGGPR